MDNIQLVHRRELETSAIHEASHAALVRMFGGLASPEIWPTGETDRFLKAWGGTCRMLAAPGTLAASPANWRQLVGMAGLVGECLYRGDEDWMIGEALEFADDMSDSDRQLIGDGIDGDDLEACIAALKSVWRDVMIEAGWLILIGSCDHVRSRRPGLVACINSPSG